jgi:hypothetical protein
MHDRVAFLQSIHAMDAMQRMPLMADSDALAMLLQIMV